MVRVSPNSRGADMSGPLSGIRVVDFSRVLAGPLCARTLLDLGAEVIKIEPPRPDVSRFAFPSTPGMSGYYAQQNAGKRNVSIDLNVPAARALALRLCDTADVFVENFRAGTLGFFGLDYETLAARNPRLIYASITGYGQGGPWQGRMAYAPTVQAAFSPRDPRLGAGRPGAGTEAVRPGVRGGAWVPRQQHPPLRRGSGRAA